MQTKQRNETINGGPQLDHIYVQNEATKIVLLEIKKEYTQGIAD